MTSVKDSKEKYLYEWHEKFDNLSKIKIDEQNTAENISHEMDLMIKEKNDTIKKLDKEIGLLDRVVRKAGSAPAKKNKVEDFMVTVGLMFLTLLVLKYYFLFAVPLALNLGKTIFKITMDFLLL
jgi:hypothetical protein